MSLLSVMLTRLEASRQRGIRAYLATTWTMSKAVSVPMSGLCTSKVAAVAQRE